jgi:hypothetical protein
MSTPPVAPSALKGWAALQFAVNHLLPQDLAKAQALRAATLQELKRG